MLMQQANAPDIKQYLDALSKKNNNNNISVIVFGAGYNQDNGLEEM